MRPTRLLALPTVLAVAMAHGVAPPSQDEPAKPGRAAISAAEAHHFADQVTQSASKISQHYVKPIPEHRLVAKALIELHAAAGAPLPDSLKGDQEKVLAGSDLFQETMKARRPLGDVPALRGEAAIRISLQAMVSALDPYSVYVNEPETRGLRVVHKAGVGLTLGAGQGTNGLVVRGVGLGGPAAAQRIRPGDAILEIDGEATRALNAAAGNAKLEGMADTQVTLVVCRGEQPPRTLKLIRRQFREETILGVQRQDGGGWDFLLDRERRIGLIRVGTLQEDAAEELQQALANLKQADGRGLILDLRDCPGGLLDEATAAVQLFIKSGVVAKLKHRDDEETISVFHRQGETTLPLIVLISPETSGGGELIAAALQDHGRAAIAGQRSKGKASIQRPVPLGIGGPHSVRLTTGYFFRPSGKNLNRFPESKSSDSWGVQPDPDLEVRLSTQLRQDLRDWRMLHDLRPSNSREKLPLDDPEADPVLALARRYMEKAK